jgi:hypothetical protein
VAGDRLGKSSRERGWLRVPAEFVALVQVFLAAV